MENEKDMPDEYEAGAENNAGLLVLHWHQSAAVLEQAMPDRSFECGFELAQFGPNGRRVAAIHRLETTNNGGLPR
jgi:hypothetical protein